MNIPILREELQTALGVLRLLQSRMTAVQRHLAAEQQARFLRRAITSPYEVLSILACLAVGGFIVALYLKNAEAIADVYEMNVNS